MIFWVTVGKIVFELFDDLAPKTCENFRALCTGEKGETSEGVRRWYKNTFFHRVIRGFMVQGGDFTKLDGTGGESVFGGRFDDENLETKHSRPGLLSMSNMGPNTNGSQFFITCVPAPHLDGKNVVFGRVLTGRSVLRFVEREPVVEGTDRPGMPIKIVDCGELKGDAMKTEDDYAASEINATEMRKKRNRRHSDSSGSGSDNERKGRSSKGRDREIRSNKRSKYAEDEKGRGDGEKLQREPDEPAQPRVDTKGREVKGRGAVRGHRQVSSERHQPDKVSQYDSRGRDSRWNREGRWSKIDDERRDRERYDRRRDDYDRRDFERDRIYSDHGYDRRDERGGMVESRIDERDRGRGYREEERDRRRDDRGQESESGRNAHSRESGLVDSFGRDARGSRTQLNTNGINGDSKERDGEPGDEGEKIPSRSLVSYSGAVAAPPPPPPKSLPKRSKGQSSSSKPQENSKGDKREGKEETSERKSSPAFARQGTPDVSPHHSDVE